MYSSVPSPPSTWTGPAPTLDRSPVSPTSPSTRPGRLRGLSYLRSYTQNHLLSRDHSSSGSSSTQQRPSTLARATSYPSPTSSSRGSTVASSATQNPRQTSPTAPSSTNDLLSARSSNQENLSSTSGWLPTGEASELQTSTIGSSPTVLSPNSTAAATSDSTPSMARTRSATVGDATGMPEVGDSESVPVNEDGSKGMAHQLPSIRFTAHQDPRAQRPSLVFSPMARILPTGKETIKIGRYSERDNQPQQAANVPSYAPVGFKSKVVSRRHCEFWYSGGRWFIKDVKSSSGTFLNHIRLSSPGTESRPFPVNDGDIVQLGIDFKGGEEMIFRCVKIRVELNKGWQSGPSSFNVQSHKRLRELNNLGKPAAGGSSQDCSICLGPIAPCQSLFVAPCSHTWHFKCIRVIINGPHWPHFICPNCRSVADLEAELDDPYTNGEWEEVLAEETGAVQTPERAPAAPASAIRQQYQQQKSSEDSALSAASTRAVDPEAAQPEPEPLLEQSDVEIADASDDSEVRRSVHQTADLRYLNMRDSPSPSIDSQTDQLSSSTVAPVNIASRKPVSGLAGAASSHLSRPDPRTDRSTRTPSPNGLPSSMNDHLTGAEGPMTPRNDVGPFIFDGSAGRASDAAVANIATMNLNAAADTPPLQNQHTS